jgi:hypothetical protein
MSDRPDAERTNDRVSTGRDPNGRVWPEEPMPRIPIAVKRGRFARVVRVLGDTFLTAGVSRGLTGDLSVGDSRAASNVVLFGLGTAEGHEANRVSGDD